METTRLGAPRGSGLCQLRVTGHGEGWGEEQSPHSRLMLSSRRREGVPLSSSGLGPCLTWFCSETEPQGLAVYQRQVAGYNLQRTSVFNHTWSL